MDHEAIDAMIGRVVRTTVTHLPPCLGWDDLRQEGWVAVLECESRYDPGRGATFETFASHRVRGALLDLLRRSTEGPRHGAWRRVGNFEAVAWRELTTPAGVTASRLRDELRSRVEACRPSARRLIGAHVYRDTGNAELAAAYQIRVESVEQMMSTEIGRIRRDIGC